MQGNGSSQADTSAAYICTSCGTQYGESAAPPTRCIICADERYGAAPEALGWTTMEELSRTHANRMVRLESDLYSIETRPRFAEGHRALLVRTEEGNALWDPTTLVEPETVGRLRERGGVRAIAISHPHFFGSMVEWSRALGSVPIYVHELCRPFLTRRDASVVTWSGKRRALFGGLALVHGGGHFEGSQVLHWPAGAEGRGVLLAGDHPRVAPDRRWVGFMQSYATFVPMSELATRDLVESLRPLAFDRLYGSWPGDLVAPAAKEVVERSAERHVEALRGTRPAGERSATEGAPGAKGAPMRVLLADEGGVIRYRVVSSPSDESVDPDLPHW